MIFSKDINHDDLVVECILKMAGDFPEWSKLMAKKGWNVDIMPYDRKPMLTIKKPSVPTTEKVSIAERRFKGGIIKWTRRGWREA